MPSQTDLDQGGTFRLWTRQFFGPSVGWFNAPGQNILRVLASGTYTIDPSTNYVEVATGGAVILNLPSVINPPDARQPGLFADSSILIVDVAGNTNGTTNTITINPVAGQTIMGLASLSIGNPYGSWTLEPNPAYLNWTAK